MPCSVIINRVEEEDEGFFWLLRWPLFKDWLGIGLLVGRCWVTAFAWLFFFLASSHRLFLSPVKLSFILTHKFSCFCSSYFLLHPAERCGGKWANIFVWCLAAINPSQIWSIVNEDKGEQLQVLPISFKLLGTFKLFRLKLFMLGIIIKLRFFNTSKP